MEDVASGCRAARSRRLGLQSHFVCSDGAPIHDDLREAVVHSSAQ